MLFTLRSLACSRNYQIVNANSAIQVIKHGPNGGPIVAKMPALNPVVIDINEDNGELYVVFNSSTPSTRNSTSFGQEFPELRKYFLSFFDSCIINGLHLVCLEVQPAYVQSFVRVDDKGVSF